MARLRENVSRTTSSTFVICADTVQLKARNKYKKYNSFICTVTNKLLSSFDEQFQQLNCELAAVKIISIPLLLNFTTDSTKGRTRA